MIDDHANVVYVETHDDEQVITAAGLPCRAVPWFSERDVTDQRVLSDDALVYWFPPAVPDLRRT